MRSHFADRIRQLQRTNDEAAEALERGLQEHSLGQRERLAGLRSELTELDELEARAKAAVRSLAPRG